MNCWLRKNNVPWTFGGSPWAWMMNCLRVVGPVERRLAERFIQARREVDDRRVAIQLQGYAGELYFPPGIADPNPVSDVGGAAVHLALALLSDSADADYRGRCGVRLRLRRGNFHLSQSSPGQANYRLRAVARVCRVVDPDFFGYPNVEIVACALAEQPGSAFIREAGIASALTSETTATPVSVESIDSYCEKRDVRISYLKADLEGYEMNVLRGAAKAIKLRKPRVAITTYHNREHAREITGFLRSLNADYQFLVKGICRLNGNPIMLHAW